MITNMGRIAWSPNITLGTSWRYAPGEIVITCDAPGCGARTTPAGLEHNGPGIEAIYLRDDDSGWSLDERDLCPQHAPPLTP